MEFLINPPDIISHRVDAQAQFVADLFVGLTLGQTFQHLTFARRQRGGLIVVRRTRGLERQHDFARDGRGHRRATLMNFADRFQ